MGGGPDYQECSEDVCIMRVQEMLQVENVFHLQVIGEGQDTQLSLSWRTLDEKRKEEEFCEECGTRELRKMIDGLVEKLVGKREEIVEKPVVVVEKSQRGILYERWENDELEWFKNGSGNDLGKYVGEIRNGFPNGQGTETFSNGDKYVGEWKEGSRDGEGTFISSYGNKYKGEFKDGERNGQGTLTFSTGIKYEGEWKDGELIQGTYTHPDGEKYVGEYWNGKRNGYGSLTFPNGYKFVGEFREGGLWNTTKYDKDGNIIERVVEGVKQK